MGGCAQMGKIEALCHLVPSPISCYCPDAQNLFSKSQHVHKSKNPCSPPLWEKMDDWDVLGSCHQQTDSLSNWHFHLETQHGLAKATNRRENHSRSDSICADTYIMVGWNFGCASITLHTHIFSHAKSFLLNLMMLVVVKVSLKAIIRTRTGHFFLLLHSKMSNQFSGQGATISTFLTTANAHRNWSLQFFNLFFFSGQQLKSNWVG